MAEAPQEQPAPERAPVPGLALIVSMVWGAGLMMGGAAAVMSPMMFDAPGSEKDPYVWKLFYCVVSFPVVCVLTIAGSWIAYAFLRHSRTPFARVFPIVLACLPLIPIAAFAVLIGFAH